MVGINLSIHPLFFIFGLFYAISGKIFLFIICTATAVIHELGHSFVASNMGYKLNKIVLMPFGAVVRGNIDGLTFADQIKIALAGPIINIVVSLLFIAFWWIYPDLYAFSDVIVSTNISMAMVNLLPVYPLDGGRIIFAHLANKLGYDKAFLISKIVGAVFSFLLCACFVLGLFFNIMNYSLLFFSLFVVFGTFNREKENKYVKILSVLSKENLERGIPLKKFAVHQDISIKRLISIIDSRAVNEVDVYKDDKKIATLSQEKLEKLIEKSNIYSKLSENLQGL